MVVAIDCIRGPVLKSAGFDINDMVQNHCRWCGIVGMALPSRNRGERGTLPNGVQWRAVWCCINGSIDELNLHLNRDIHIM